MKPFIHATNSAKKFGGKPEDYLPIHNFMDSSKAHVPDHRHRAILHTSFGCYVAEEVFGTVKVNSEGKEYSPRDIAEQHIIEDLGFIPTVQDYLNHMTLEPWFGGGKAAKERKTPVNLKPKDIIQNAIKEAAGQLEATLLPAMQNFLDENPEVDSIGWYQYIPSFNDGDPCTLRIGEFEAKDQEGEEVYPTKGADILEKLRDDFGEDVLEFAFESDKEITLVRGDSKLTVNDYDCGY